MNDSKVLNCPACNSSRTRSVKLDSYQILSCLVCRLQWVEGDLDQQLETTNRINVQYMSPESIGTPDTYKPYAEFFSFVERRYYHKSLRILDIGCGSGIFVEYSVSRGHDCIGIDIDDVLDQSLPLSIRQRIKIAPIESFQFDKLKQFDVITLWDTFEHLKDPFEVLDYLKRCLSPSGIIYLKVNNRWDVYNLATDFLAYISPEWHKTILVKCFGTENTKYPHYWNFSKRGMIVKLNRSGWSVIECSYSDTPASRLTRSKALGFLINCAYLVNRIIAGGKSGDYYICREEE